MIFKNFLQEFKKCMKLSKKIKININQKHKK